MIKLLHFCSWQNQAKAFQSNGEDDDSDDDFTDDEELQSPIDEVDPFIFFVETVQGKHYLYNSKISSYWLLSVSSRVNLKSTETSDM